MPVIVVAFDSAAEWRPAPVAFAGLAHRSFERSDGVAEAAALVDGLAMDAPYDDGELLAATFHALDSIVEDA